MHDFTPVTVSRRSSLEEHQFALTQIYRQVLERQLYTAERQSVAALEKDFLTDKIGVRRFLKQFACTDIYRNQYYDKLSNVKFMEVCFKHFLGRAIADHQEMKVYNEILLKQGCGGFVTAILDSEEYRKAFGCFTVPYPREQTCYRSPEVFLESKFLNEEHFGQRGHSIPTMYWRQLGLLCRNGVCRRPEADDAVTANAADRQGTNTIETLLHLLKPDDVGKAKALLTQLSTEEREALLALR